MISKETLLLIPNYIKPIIEFFKDKENEIIEIDNLPFAFKIPKAKVKKPQIKVPRFLKTLIPIIGVNKLTKNQVRTIINNLVKSLPTKSDDLDDQSDKKLDKKLIESILEELLKIQEHKD